MVWKGASSVQTGGPFQITKGKWLNKLARKPLNVKLFFVIIYFSGLCCLVVAATVLSVRAAKIRPLTLPALLFVTGCCRTKRFVCSKMMVSSANFLLSTHQVSSFFFFLSQKPKPSVKTELTTDKSHTAVCGWPPDEAVHGGASGAPYFCFSRPQMQRDSRVALEL